LKLKSLRPSYLIPRLRQIAFSRRFPDAPWLVESAVFLLESWLKPTDVGLEWGSGRSTVWLARRMKRLITIEADRTWYEEIRKRLREADLLARTDYRHIPCELEEIDEPASHPYADVAAEFPDGSFDFCLVDGHIRATCFRSVLRKIKPGGLLALDNANRYLPNRVMGQFATAHQPLDKPSSPLWGQLLQEISAWRAIHTTDKIWDTRFWVRPCGD
jgi:SAM-dependent methyltransferase